MRLEAENVSISECLTVGEFVKVLKERTGNMNISNPTVHYHLTENGDKLDYVDWCGLKMIVQNEKAKSFTPGENYGGRKERIANKMKL